MEAFGDRRQRHQVQCDEGLRPVVGDQGPLQQLPVALPGRSVLPTAALAVTERPVGVRLGQRRRPVGDPGHPAQCIGGLECRAVADRAGGRHVHEVGRGHLAGVDQVPPGGVQSLEHVEPGAGKALVVSLAVVLIRQPVDIGLLAVLEDVVRAVDHLVGIAERIPVVVGDRAVVAVAHHPVVHEAGALDLEWHLLAPGVPEQTGRDDLVLRRPPALADQMTPRSERLEYLSHGVLPGRSGSLLSRCRSGPRSWACSPRVRAA